MAKILVVAHDPTWREVMEIMLQKEGHERYNIFFHTSKFDEFTLPVNLIISSFIAIL